MLGLAFPFPHGIQVSHTGELTFAFALALHEVGVGHLPVNNIGVGIFALALALVEARMILVGAVSGKMVATTQKTLAIILRSNMSKTPVFSKLIFGPCSLSLNC